MATIQTKPHFRAFLDLIATCIGTSGSSVSRLEGYDLIGPGVAGFERNSDLSCHPFSTGRAPLRKQDPPSAIYTTAAGRYLIDLPLWRALAVRCNLHTFGPVNQDLAAMRLMEDFSVTKALFDGELVDAICEASAVWPGVPGSLFSRSTITVEGAVEIYERLLADNTPE